jgi:glycine/D-amino acid oxidase-like deaminating enzyme
VTAVRSEGEDVDAPGCVNCAGLYRRPAAAAARHRVVSIKPERHQMCFFRRPRDFGVHPAVADAWCR